MKRWFVSLLLGACALGLSTAPSGCLVVIRADTPGEHCAFTGKDTDCGKCIQTSCQTSVDKCCADKDCSSSSYSSSKATIELLDQCASGDKAVCVRLTTSSSSTGAEKVLSTCLAQNCAAVCGKGAQSHRKCTDSDLHSCSCTDADESSGTPCSKDSVGGDSAVCVVGRPESGWTSGCTCATVSCKNTSSGCQCSNTGESPLGWQTCEPSGGALRCCLRLGNLGGFTCSCGDSKYSTCSSSEYELSSCSETAVTTALKNVLVDKCDN